VGIPDVLPGADFVADYQYEGTELEVFQHALRWKAYFASKIRPYLRGSVLEVGAGMGANTRLLCDGNQAHWTALEPDRALAERMRQSLAAQPLPVPTDVRVGTSSDLAAADRFDAILYVDVLEHIQGDGDELGRARDHLTGRGALIVLSPAHQWLFTDFDRAIGHHRRYSARSLKKVGPTDLSLEKLIYLDSVGMLASATNRLLLKSSRPTLGQIRFWDSVLVRTSRLVDPLLAHRVGKSVLGIWRKENR
jgi:SAM-dependent methyltransferase